ncbi:MAG: carboxypeptidase-like regulatory domain-containing protein, partial [Bryobacteraceae bacterium]
MRNRAKRCLGALLLLSAAGVLSPQGGNPTGNLSGTVTDTSGAVVPKAVIQATEINTGAKLATVSGADGQFYVGNVAPGTYNVTVTVPGFKAATYSSVQVVVGQTYMLKAVMQPGDVTSSVTVEAGAQVLETTESSVGLTVTGPAITHVPTASNSALYGLALMSPDLQTIGGPRQSSADGLPGGAVNITFDGIPAQWQSGKSGDPVFAQVYPNIDDVSEFTIVSAANSANDTGEGAVQLKFVSQRGTNQYHGGGWEYFRNDYLNANYYFNNLAGLPRQKMRYDQVGGKIGGPILKNKLFFFVDLSVWVRPQGVSRTRTILTPAASSGMYTYAPTTMPSGSLPSWVTCNNGAGTCTANLLQMAQASGGNGQIDKIVGQSLAAMQQAVTAPGVHLLAPPSYYQQQLTFNNSGAYTQHMPDVRLDWNPKPNHSFEADYHLTRLELNPDVLNSDDYTYPVAPFSSNQAGYYADRQIWAWA